MAQTAQATPKLSALAFEHSWRKGKNDFLNAARLFAGICVVLRGEGFVFEDSVPLKDGEAFFWRNSKDKNPFSSVFVRVQLSSTGLVFKKFSVSAKGMLEKDAENDRRSHRQSDQKSIALLKAVGDKLKPVFEGKNSL